MRKNGAFVQIGWQGSNVSKKEALDPGKVSDPEQIINEKYKWENKQG